MNKRYLVEVSVDRGKTWTQASGTNRYRSAQVAEDVKIRLFTAVEMTLKHYRVKTVYNERKR